MRAMILVAAIVFNALAGSSAIYAAEFSGFSLYDADTDEWITDINSNEEYTLAGRSIAITANIVGVIDSVTINVVRLAGGFSSTKIEKVSPYASFGDFSGNLKGEQLPEGTYTVTAMAGGETISVEFSLKFSATDSVPDSAPPPSSLDLSRDYLSLHYDFAPDPDDVLSAVFDRAIVEVEAIDTSRILMVKGTVGLNASKFKQLQSDAMDRIWPGIRTLDAKNDFDETVVETAKSWLQTLDNGGDIWVKEGGQSDFTASVIQRIKLQDSSVDTNNRIHVVQHSAWNENNTTTADLRYVKNNAHYIKIADGNSPDNGTADLKSLYNNNNWWNQAMSSSYGSIVEVAKSFLRDRVDGSDSVELLHILGISTNHINDLDDMLKHYLQVGPGSESDTLPENNQPAPPPSNCSGCISGFHFIDATNNEDLGRLITDGGYAYANRNLAIRVDTFNASKVKITLNGPISSERTEGVAPYASFGDRGGDYFGKSMPAGAYSLTATAMDSAGSALQTVSVNFILTTK